MADTAEQMAVNYPFPSYRFVVAFGDETIAFMNVSGLNITYETAQYRDGTGAIYNMPVRRNAQVTATFSKGIFRGQSFIKDWLDEIQFNRVGKRDITISITDDSGQELLITWTLYNAFPTELGAPTLDASSNEIAIETLTVQADYISVVYH